MQHTLVAVFDNRTDAQSAMNELLSSGFTRTDVRLSTGDATDDLSANGSLGSDGVSATRAAELDRSADGDTGITASIKNFFSDLFGSDNAEHASRYEGAVSRGHHVLTLTADSLPEVERAADIVERYGPTDIDETSSGTPGMGMSAGAMGLGASAGLQQSSSMSAQSASNLGSGSSSLSGSANASSPSSVQAGSIPELDNPGDRGLFQQQSINQAEPMGGTYQEPQGQSGLTATGGTSLQASTLRENAVQGSSLEGTLSSTSTSGTSPLAGSSLGQAAATTGSQQRDTALGGTDTTGLGTSGVGTSGASSTSSLTSSSGALSGSSNLDKQRSGTRIFSRERNDSSLSTASGSSLGSTSGSSLGSISGASSDATGTSLSSSGSALGSTSTPASQPTSGLAASSSTGMGIDDDSYYRQHFDSNYSASGAKYDDYLPAYSYGSESARSDRYTNRAWDDVESDLRTDWDTRNASSADQSTWEKMKNAVRAGWDRITGDDDDDYYRSHYTSNYEGSGAMYDDVKPAYSYGSEMRKSEMYRNRPWDDVETDLRSGWDNRIDGRREFSTTGSDSSEPSTWDRVKNAVRHGWDKMTDDDDDSYYRNHYTSTYGASGASYDEFRPAYAYGSSMARDDKYRGRQWDTVEADLRSDWDTRYSTGGQSTWEKMKAAVRHGWDRMTNDDDDLYYRNHWNSVYGAGGESYDAYQPAYSYGSTMAQNDKYRGRQWNDVENDLRTDWDTRYPAEQSTWDKMKSAVRAGWDRMMR